jgi:2-methylcitrate dehydratase PrpD
VTAVAAPALSVSERLARHVVGTTFEDLPVSVIERTKDLLVHQLSLAFAGRFTEEGERVATIAQQLSGDSGASTIVGHSAKATLLDAIFAHSMLSGGPLDDFQFPSGLHLGRAAHPVAWVVGERELSSGRELITAVVVGYDAACKLALPELLRSYARRPAEAFSAFAHIAIAVRLLRYDRDRAARAIARAAHFGMGVLEGKMQGVHLATSALVARDAVMAALLARPDDDLAPTVEGEHGLYMTFFGQVPAGLEASLASLGRDYSILGASTKRYPSSASHFTPLESTHSLLERSGVRAREASRLVVTLAEDFRARFAFMEAPIERGDPSDAEIVRSLRVKLAILLVDGAIEPLPTRARFREPAVQAALPKVTLAYEGDRPLDFARVEVTTTDGRTLRAEGGFTPYPKGDWSAWLRRDGARFLSERRLAELERLLTHLEDVEDVGAVLAATVPDLP